MEYLVPYNSILIPILNKDLIIKLPQNSDILVNTNDIIALKTSLASFESFPVLETYNLLGKSWDLKVMHGELVHSGSVLARISNLFSRSSQKIISKSTGIVDLSIKGKLLIHEDYSEEFVSAGFSGSVKDIDRLHSKIKINLTGAGLSPLYVHNLPLSFSCLVGVEKNKVLFKFHKEDSVLNFSKKGSFDKLVIIDYLNESEWPIVLDNLDRFSEGLCVLTCENNVAKVSFIHNLFNKIEGNRLFIENNIVFSTLWKLKKKNHKYSKIREGSRVLGKPFNKEPISGKIISFKGHYILVETENKKQHYFHYLNVFKE